MDISRDENTRVYNESIKGETKDPFIHNRKFHDIYHKKLFLNSKSMRKRKIKYSIFFIFQVNLN